MEIRISAAGASDVGRARRTNEDAFGFDLGRGLFVVCDGVGGSRAGEVASQSAVDCVLRSFPETLADSNDGGNELHRAIQGANRYIYQSSLNDAVYQGMCTTIVAAHFDGTRMWIAHVGDSRAYLLRRQSLHRLTEDHSQLAEKLREGLTHSSKHAVQQWDSMLTQAVGASEIVIPAVSMVRVELGDCFIFATDGVSKALRTSEMLALLLTTSSPEQACQQLVGAANDAGGHDNATCVIVEID